MVLSTSCAFGSFYNMHEIHYHFISSLAFIWESQTVVKYFSGVKVKK